VFVAVLRVSWPLLLRGRWSVLFSAFILIFRLLVFQPLMIFWPTV